MRNLLFFIALNFFVCPLFSQYVYTIKADSVKITNCDSAELILENHTQGVQAPISCVIIALEISNGPKRTAPPMRQILPR